MRSSIPIAALLVIMVGVLNSLGLIPHRTYTNADFGIATYRGQHDQDHDGIDDQTDILQSVQAYLATSTSVQTPYSSSG